MLVAALVILLTAHILVLVLCTLFIALKHFSKVLYMEKELLPNVSVLVAARNEENNIINCLQSLSKLNYPAEKFEVLIGNDSSTDNTAAIVENFIAGKPNFKLVEIEGQLGNARGKANVLAQLAHIAKGEYFFITDADMQLPPDWIQSHLKHFSGDVYMTSGTTIARGNGLWAKMQQLEWTYLMGLFNVFDAMKPLTAMGNNMAVSAEAYFHTGGYEKIPFSVTEDVALMRELQKVDMRHRHILSADNLAFTQASGSINSVLKQRQRWYAGAKDQPFYIWILFLIYALFLPALLVLFFIEPEIAIYALLAKCLADGILLLLILKLLRLPLIKILWLPVFEIYLQLINPLILFFSLSSRKVEWKEREF